MIRVMDHIDNHFIKSSETLKLEFKFKSIVGNFKNIYLPGMYIIVKGSYLNDGIHKILSATDTEITMTYVLSEENTGEDVKIYASIPPKHFIELTSEIKGFSNDRLGIVSESIDDYSVSYSEGQSWEEVYKTKLNQYRRVYSDIPTNKR